LEKDEVNCESDLKMGANEYHPSRGKISGGGKIKTGTGIWRKKWIVVEEIK